MSLNKTRHDVAVSKARQTFYRRRKLGQQNIPPPAYTTPWKPILDHLDVEVKFRKIRPTWLNENGNPFKPDITMSSIKAIIQVDKSSHFEPSDYLDSVQSRDRLFLKRATESRPRWSVLFVAQSELDSNPAQVLAVLDAFMEKAKSHRGVIQFHPEHMYGYIHQ